SVFVPSRLGQHIYQSGAGETEIRQSDPGKHAANGQPDTVPLRAEVTHGKRYRNEAGEYCQTFRNIRRGGGHTSATVPPAPTIDTRRGKQIFRAPRAKERLQNKNKRVRQTRRGKSHSAPFPGRVCLPAGMKARVACGCNNTWASPSQEGNVCIRLSVRA